MIINEIKRIASKLHCRRLLPLIFRLLRYPSNKARFSSLDESEAYAQSVHRDVNNSSIRKNLVEVSTEYDLQIVVPVYNTEKYLRECIDSILTQKTKYTYCLIIVNDGSTDNSDEILRQYEELPNVDVIRQKNKGLSGARNTAINTLNAKYVTFVDSDDRLASGSIERLMDVAVESNADIVDGEMISFGEGARTTILSTKAGEKKMMDVRGFATGKIVKSELFSKLAFSEGYWFEDTLMLLVLFPMAKKFVGAAVPVYEYRGRAGSITSTSKGNPKSLDSFYITRRLLKDAVLLGIDIADEEYVNVLINRQMQVNFRRIVSIGDMKLLYAFFVLSKEMIKNAYSSIGAGKEKSKDIIDGFLSLSFRDFVIKYL